MISNLLLGAIVVLLTIVIQLVGLRAVSRLNTMVELRLRLGEFVGHVVTAAGVFVVLGVEIWLWTFVHWMLGGFPDFDTTLFFSIETFSTLGYGEVIPQPEWRVFSALQGTTGFVMVGWAAGYLIAAIGSDTVARERRDLLSDS